MVETFGAYHCAGGFCAVPGSHKSNFPIPPALADLADEELAQYVQQPALDAGDVLIFSEATLHGTLPWTANHQRRTVIYRFAPAGSAYGRGYVEWPAEMLDGMSEAQRAVCAGVSRTFDGHAIEHTSRWRVPNAGMRRALSSPHEQSLSGRRRQRGRTETT